MLNFSYKNFAAKVKKSQNNFPCLQIPQKRKESKFFPIYVLVYEVWSNKRVDALISMIKCFYFFDSTTFLDARAEIRDLLRIENTTFSFIYFINRTLVLSHETPQLWNCKAKPLWMCVMLWGLIGKNEVIFFQCTVGQNMGVASSQVT